jgi:hypothetical protein
MLIGKCLKRLLMGVLDGSKRGGFGVVISLVGLLVRPCYLDRVVVHMDATVGFVFCGFCVYSTVVFVDVSWNGNTKREFWLLKMRLRMNMPSGNAQLHQIYRNTPHIGCSFMTVPIQRRNSHPNRTLPHRSPATVMEH